MNGGYQIVDLGRIKTEEIPVSLDIERELIIDDNKPVFLSCEIESVYGTDTDFVRLNMWLSKVDSGHIKSTGFAELHTSYFGVCATVLGLQYMIMISKKVGDIYLININGVDT